MAFTMSLWGVHDCKLAELPKQRLDSEDRLETWIAQDVSLLGMELLIVGRQVPTRFGGRIDLLAVDSDGNLVIVELKRDKTPREIVAQVLDYASWVNDLSFDEINQIASDYLKKPIVDAFRDRFQEDLPETINSDHRMLIVASELDDSSERIVQYLSSKHSLDINVVFFTCFQDAGCEFVGRSWLMDPKVVEERKPPSGKKFNPDFTKYDVTINGKTYERLSKRAAIFAVVKFLCDSGISPGEIAGKVPSRQNTMFRSAEGKLGSAEFSERMKAAESGGGKRFEEHRFYCDDGELIQSGGRTYAFTNQWGGPGCTSAIDKLIEGFPVHNISCTISS